MTISLLKFTVTLAFIQAVIATLGSLYFSEILLFTPCTLCWYQRIAMYPLVLILGVGLIDRDEKLYRYVLPLSLTGWAISFYHILIQYGVIAESSYVCTLVGTCVQRFLYAFISIPLLSFLAFTVINILMIFYIVGRNRGEGNK